MSSKSQVKKDQRDQFAADAAKLETQKSKDHQKRIMYLLGQTDIFAHFLNLKKKRSNANSEDTEVDVAPVSPSKIAADGTHRHRKTETQEDAELLKEDGDDDDTINLTESPSYVKGGKMRDYQVQGLNWLISLFNNGINGILADEMGLGKTLQTISFLGYLKHFKSMNGPHLVIVPKSTLHNWISEFKKWVPDLDVFMFHGMKDERQELVNDILLPGKFEVCVTSFEMCLLEKTHLKKFSWQYIVIDEAHRIKNENSALSQIVRIFNCRNRLLLTGTPLQNNLHELWALLNFLLPDVFSSSEDFDSWFEVQGGDQDTVVKQLHKVLQPFLLRRIKADVEKSLLPKLRTNLYVGMSSMQKKWYQKLLEKDIAAVNGVSSKREGKTRLLNIVMQLRKCCNHPYLFDGAEPGPPFTTDQHLVDNSGKMAILDRFLPYLKEQGSRVLLFSQMSRMLDILEDYCLFKEFEYCRIDGNTPHEERVAAIDEYNQEGSTKFIFLLTTRAGGLGINLATADTVIMYDNDWNPQVDLQAEDRAHRIGQKKQVKVYRFMTENSVEEKVIERAAQKLRLDQLVIQQGRATTGNKAASKDELLGMIRHGAGDIFNNIDSSIATDDIKDIIQRSMEKTNELESKYKEMGLDDLQKFSVDGSGSVYQWEGEDFSNKRKSTGFWIQPAKRERKDNYSEKDYYAKAMNYASTRGPRVPKPKSTQYYSFQFLPQRLYDLQAMETLAHQKEVEYVIPPGKDEDKEAEKSRLEEQAKIDEAEPWTEELAEERDSLSSKGYANWSKVDFKNFIKACEKYGRDQSDLVFKEVEGKTVSEVRDYFKAFMKNYKKIEDYDKIIAKIEEGEERNRQFFLRRDVLAKRISTLRNPLVQLKLNYGQLKGKAFAEEEDRFLLVMLDKFGYGHDESYELIRQEIKRSPMFRFNWYLKSRNAVEIQRRCNTLMTVVMKEHDDEAKRAKKKG